MNIAQTVFGTMISGMHFVTLMKRLAPTNDADQDASEEAALAELTNPEFFKLNRCLLLVGDTRLNAKLLHRILRD